MGCNVRGNRFENDWKPGVVRHPLQHYCSGMELGVLKRAFLGDEGCCGIYNGYIGGRLRPHSHVAGTLLVSRWASVLRTRRGHGG